MYAVKGIIQKCKPKLVFIQETKLGEFRGNSVRKLWNQPNIEFACSPALGSSMYVRFNVFRVTDQFVFRRFIMLIGTFPSRNFRYGLVNVYGPAVDAEKSSFLDELLAFMKPWQIPWCIGRDFNMLLDPEEKLGQSLNTSLIEIFKAFVFEASIMDIPLQGVSIRGVTIGILPHLFGWTDS
ncbi:hypothetical protein V6N12_050562 [Hibiscus sabdariffa]|uniref:Endonuclease/exonuclease/phosphatase domain-containing protein n=1 Tax=Hibiscus sabdariffa TaxID=183260 RepID=A0ABR2GCR6_9ROSI